MAIQINDLQHMTLRELRELANTLGLKGWTRMGKDELVQLIWAHR